MNVLKKVNYFLSGWIANLGVVPLFSFAFFLFLPIFLSFNFLLLRVCIVLEAIIISLFNNKFIQLRRIFLSIPSPIVKAFFISSWVLFLANGQANAEIKEYFLAKGEQIEIQIPEITTISIGNNEVIGHKLLKSKKILLIKGRMLGFSDLKIWTPKKLMTIHFYVLSKKEQLKQSHIASTLKDTSLSLKVKGRLLIISGSLEKVSDYLIIQKIAQKRPENLIFEVRLSHDVRRKIFADIYAELYGVGAESVLCQNYGVQISCQLEGIDLDHNSVNYLINKYQVQIKNKWKYKKEQNFKVHIKLIQVENAQGRQLGTGLHKFKTNLKNILEKNTVPGIASNPIIFQDNGLKASLIASPSFILSIGNQTQIQLGTDVPIKTQENDSEIINWFFSGIKIDINLKALESHLFTELKTELTHPGQNNSNHGSKHATSFFISPDKFINFFEIKTLSSQDHRENLPWIKHIPLVKNIFEKSYTANQDRLVLGYIQLKEQKDDKK